MLHKCRMPPSGQGSANGFEAEADLYLCDIPVPAGAGP